MKKLALILMTAIIMTSMAISCVWAVDDTNPYVIKPNPPIAGGHK